MEVTNNRRKNRKIFLAKQGEMTFAMKLSSAVLFQVKNGSVYLVDETGDEFLCDKNLMELEAELDKKMFFRANRQYIVNFNFIRYFKPYERVKLIVVTSLQTSDHVIIVSQVNARDFKNWMSGIFK